MLLLLLQQEEPLELHLHLDHMSLLAAAVVDPIMALIRDCLVEVVVEVVVVDLHLVMVVVDLQLVLLAEQQEHIHHQ